MSHFLLCPFLSRESDEMEIRMTASLVLKNVSAKDLSKNYTCKLETTSDPSSSVTITLATIPLAQEGIYLRWITLLTVMKGRFQQCSVYGHM